MKCPRCNNDLCCKLSIETELNDRPIYTYYQWWECKSCTSKYFATLEESRVNIFNDSLEHCGYYADEIDWKYSLDWALQCPQKKNTRCNCIVHQQLPPSCFKGDIAWYTNN